MGKEVSLDEEVQRVLKRSTAKYFLFPRVIVSSSK